MVVTMRIGKVEVRQQLVKNNMTGATMSKFFEEHFVALETIYTDKSIIFFCICKHFKDLDDTVKRIPEYKIVLQREDKVAGIYPIGITDEEGEYVYDQRH